MIKLYETEKFYVRPFTKSDITDRYLSWFHDQEVTKYTSHGLFSYTKEQAFDFFEKSEKKGDLIWVIMAKGPANSKETRKYLLIGNISLQNINQINRTAEFAGIIGEKDYWKKGIGTEAIRFLFEHGFNKLNLQKIYLGTAETNIGMISIAEKLGMTNEGVFRNHVFLEGKYVDILQYRILEEEWNDA